MIPEIGDEISAQIPNVEKERSLLKKVYDLFVNDFNADCNRWGRYVEKHFPNGEQEEGKEQEA